MEGGALFNPGILGGGFNWFMGQVADDSTWRENISSTKFEDKHSIPGWGYRYKVRIMGLHSQHEATIKTEELSWATLMYPVTAGGGQGAAFQTPNVRQGNFVFGFFMDGPAQQVPVIMGILGNNAQTEKQTKTGLTGGENFKAQSGFAESKKPKGKAKEKSPDDDLQTTKPKSEKASKEEALLKSMKSFITEKGFGGDSFTVSAEIASQMGVIPTNKLSELRAKTAERLNQVGNRVGDRVTDPGALSDLIAERNFGR